MAEYPKNCGQGQDLKVDGNVGIGIGSDAPQANLHLKSDSTALLKIEGDQSDYINAGILLQANSKDAKYRGLGSFYFDKTGKTEWYSGTPYADSDKFIIARRGEIDGHSNDSAQKDFSLLTVASSGYVGIGTVEPSAKLEVSSDKGGDLVHLGGAGYKGTIGLDSTGMYIYHNSAHRNLSFGVGDGSTGKRDNLVIDTNGNVGIGKTDPGEKLEVAGNIKLPTGAYIGYSQRPGNNTHDGLITFYDPSNGNMKLETTYTSTGGGNILLMPSGNVGIGVTDPKETLEVVGNIKASGNVILEGDLKIKNWTIGEAPDYVFKDDYKLMELNDLEKYVNENHHLPNIPSGVEMEKEGLNLNEFCISLLEKVEELSLHLIQQNKQIRNLEARLKVS